VSAGGETKNVVNAGPLASWLDDYPTGDAVLLQELFEGRRVLA
jgi:hypothetical protein